MKIKAIKFLALLLVGIISCKEEEDLDRIFDFKLQSDDLHGIWTMWHCVGVSLDDFYMGDDEDKYARLVELKKDGTGTIFVSKRPEANEQEGYTTIIDINYTTDSKGITIEYEGQSETWTFADYKKTNTLNTVYKQNSNNKNDYNNYDIYALEEIRTDSALYDYCGKVRDIMHVPADRIWKDKTIVGYYNCNGCYLHFKENGEVSRKYDNQVITGTYELHEESGVDYLKVNIDDTKTDGVVVFDSTIVYVYSPKFAGMYYEGYESETMYKLNRLDKPVEGL